MIILKSLEQFTIHQANNTFEELNDSSFFLVGFRKLPVVVCFCGFPKIKPKSSNRQCE